jgi:hypothetical protein
LASPKTTSSRHIILGSGIKLYRFLLSKRN